MVGEAEEIPDADHEQVLERVCAIDVAKDSGKVCTRLPRESAPDRRGGRAKHAAMVEALTGRFGAHHGELARMLPDQIDGLTRQIDILTTRIETLIAAIPAAAAPTPAQTPGSDGDNDGDASSTGPVHRPPGRLSALQRLDEIPGAGAQTAQVILAEIGLDMTRFPTAGLGQTVSQLRSLIVANSPRMAVQFAVAARLVRFCHPDNAGLLATGAGARNIELYPMCVGVGVDFIIGGEVARIPDFRPG